MAAFSIKYEANYYDRINCIDLCYDKLMKIRTFILEISKEFAARMQKKNIAAYAGSTAFFFILSLIPLLAFLSALLPYTGLTEDNLIKVITDFTPDFADDIMVRLVSDAYEQSMAVFSIYVNMPNSYSIYGSLATPAIMMFWLYFCISIFFFGAFINCFFHPAVKVLYDDHHKKTVRKNAKKKSTRAIRKHKDYNEFG